MCYCLVLHDSVSRLGEITEHHNSSVLPSPATQL